VPTTNSIRPSSDSTSQASPATARLITPLAVLAMLFAANCGSSGGSSNPPPPDVEIAASPDWIVDVGQRYFLDGSGTTDPNGDEEDLEFIWRLIEGGVEGSDFDDHCRDDFDEICVSNDDDHCSNDLDRICKVDDDCEGIGQCLFNTGTTSSECTTGICGIGEGNEGVRATLVADVAGPFTVRLTAIGSESNGTQTVVLDTFPSLFVTNSIFQFGGTEGAALGAVADAEEFASNASEGVADPINGNLVVIDDSLKLVRQFDLRTGAVIGPFGESDRFVNDPTALAFNPANGRLYVAEASGRVLMFDGTTGLLIAVFAEVGADPIAMRFSPVTGNLLVVYGTTDTGIREFNADGTDLGVLGETATAADQAVDFDFLPEAQDNDLLIADDSGSVVRCDFDGTDCGNFSTAANNLLPAGSPSAIAVNPSAEFTSADVLIADPVNERVIACTANGNSCETFGDTDNSFDSDYSDVFFSPAALPTTTTTTTTTTLGNN